MTSNHNHYSNSNYDSDSDSNSDSDSPDPLAVPTKIKPQRNPNRHHHPRRTKARARYSPDNKPSSQRTMTSSSQSDPLRQYSPVGGVVHSYRGRIFFIDGKKIKIISSTGKLEFALQVDEEISCFTLMPDPNPLNDPVPIIIARTLDCLWIWRNQEVVDGIRRGDEEIGMREKTSDRYDQLPNTATSSSYKHTQSSLIPLPLLSININPSNPHFLSLSLITTYTFGKILLFKLLLSPPTLKSVTSSSQDLQTDPKLDTIELVTPGPTIIPCFDFGDLSKDKDMDMDMNMNMEIKGLLIESEPELELESSINGSGGGSKQRGERIVVIGKGRTVILILGGGEVGNGKEVVGIGAGVVEGEKDLNGKGKEKQQDHGESSLLFEVVEDEDTAGGTEDVIQPNLVPTTSSSESPLAETPISIDVPSSVEIPGLAGLDTPAVGSLKRKRSRTPETHQSLSPEKKPTLGPVRHQPSFSRSSSTSSLTTAPSLSPTASSSLQSHPEEDPTKPEILHPNGKIIKEYYAYLSISQPGMYQPGKNYLFIPDLRLSNPIEPRGIDLVASDRIVEFIWSKENWDMCGPKIGGQPQVWQVVGIRLVREEDESSEDVKEGKKRGVTSFKESMWLKCWMKQRMNVNSIKGDYFMWRLCRHGGRLHEEWGDVLASFYGLYPPRSAK